MRICTLILSLILSNAAFAASATTQQPAPIAALQTEAERSGFLRTGRYEEVQRLCGEFARTYPRLVRCQEFGRSPERRPMMALVVSNSGVLNAAQARAQGLPVVLVQGGIHAGEIDGKDAGFWLLRELLADPAQHALLAKQVLVFVPVFNVDGHERFGAWNRPNQRGPEQMGWRTTAQNYNLNRDYAKVDSAEMAAMLGLVEQWDPLAAIDLHVTDGAKFEHDISIQVEPVNASDQALRAAGLALRDGVINELASKGSLPKPFYYAFEEYDNPASGFADNVPSPRFSHGYFHLRNRLGMLVEMHSWRPYPYRVKVTRNAVQAVLQQVASHGKTWLKLAHEADQRASQLAGQELALSYKTAPESRMIEFRGYHYERTHSEVSGAIMVRYDENRPQIWRVPLRDKILPDTLARAPAYGYLVPAAHAAWVARKLQIHGIRYFSLPQAYDGVAVQAWRASSTKFSANSVESHQRLEAQGAWQAQISKLTPGSLVVPIAQAKARLVLALLEPGAPDSFLAWGFFNNAFEAKEYMEDYVAEEVARSQMAADPQVKAEFERKLAQEPEFAKDPAARLRFFAQRHASWDSQFNLYPVLRLEQALPTTGDADGKRKK